MSEFQPFVVPEVFLKQIALSVNGRSIASEIENQQFPSIVPWLTPHCRNIVDAVSFAGNTRCDGFSWPSLRFALS